MRSGTLTELFSKRTVVITGAGSGIGRAAACAFADNGARLIAHLGRMHSTADAPPWECPAASATDPQTTTLLTGDFTSRDGQDAFIAAVRAHTDAVDVLVNNAGTMFGRFPADQVTDDEYERIVELNQTSVVRITRALLPLMQGREAAIINVVSISAATGGSPGSSIYSATKAFVSTYTRALARELGPQGIRVNAISPGVIDTDFHQRYSSVEKLSRTREQIPLGRLGTPEDCAPAFLFLASSELSGYITGHVLEINGGQR